MSVLSEILQNCDAKGSVYFCEIMTPPWKIDFAKRSFHCVRRGGCEIIDNEGNVENLGPGDVAVILNGENHSLQSHEKNKAENLLLCGHYIFRNDFMNSLLNGFPPVLILRDEQISTNPWLKSTLDYLVCETQNEALGSKLILDKLTEVLLVQFIRHYIKETHEGQSLAHALYDRHIGPALKLIHSDITVSWTLEQLAQEAGLSRAAFAERFKQQVGNTMFSYLSDLRMIRAKHLLEKTNLSIYDIAEQVGYASDIAFNRAFSKIVNISAGKYRTQFKNDENIS